MFFPLAVALLLALPPVPAYGQAQPQAAAQPELTRDEMRQFLLKAKVIKSRGIGKGVTGAMRLTLTDGTITHDAGFNSVDEHSTIANLKGSGGGPNVELNFVDAYRYNLAAERLRRAVGSRLHDAGLR